jgi:hypothetical protein
MPFIAVLAWRNRQRPASIICCTVWACLVAYNLLGAAGAIAAVRDEVLASREHAVTTASVDKEARQRLLDELATIPRHRPAGTVAPLLGAEKAKPQWEWTGQCKDARKGRDVRYCGAVTGLESELASARRAAEINAQLGSIEQELRAAGPVSSRVDPWAAMVAELSGLDERLVSRRIPLATPVILEICSMTLLYFAFVLFGFTHSQVMETRLSRRTTEHVVASSGLPLLPSMASPKRVSTLTRQRELCDWFFRECARPAAEGSLPEADWYKHYQDVCKDSSDTPLPLTSFRRFAERYIPEISEIDGTHYYKGVLPYMARRVVA